MKQDTAIKLFEEKKIRTHFDEQTVEWYFSVIDVIEVLTDSSNPRDYWFKMKQRVRLEEGIQLSTIYRQLKLASSTKSARPHVRSGIDFYSPSSL